uniref:Uncharacterized protein n=1 Tax=Vitis vinifera TaxID=29760 RepID=F6HQB1_VITVI
MGDCPWCDHCQKRGHTKDTCWNIHRKLPTGRNLRPNHNSKAYHGGFIPVSQAFTLVEACKPIIMVLMDLETKTISKPKIAVKVSLPSSHFLSCSIVSLSIYTHSSINEKSEHKRMGITTSLSYLLFFNIILPTLTASPILFQGFNWESSKKQGGWYNFLINSIPELSASGITHVWLPPPSQSNASEVGNVKVNGKALKSKELCDTSKVEYVNLLNSIDLQNI